MRDVVDPTLAVWGSLPPAEELLPDLATELPGVGEWPGVDDPDALRAHLADWLTSYGNAGTRRTYAYALGLPIPWVDLIQDVFTATVSEHRRCSGDCQGCDHVLSELRRLKEQAA